MSSIGAATAAGLNVVGSIVGSSRPDAATDHSKASAAQQKMQSDFDAKLGASLDDVADAQFSADRDADGRQMYERRAPGLHDAIETATDDAPESSTPISRNHAADAFGDRGNALDIDA
jgi:flagellar hook-basal body complex protein FliE